MLDVITHVGPTARGEIQWRGIERIVRTDEGLFLVLGRGLSMFVPFSALGRPVDASIVEEFHRHASEVVELTGRSSAGVG